MKDWSKTHRLAINESIARAKDNVGMSVTHLDRTVDPYLAGVTHDGVLTYTGLHATLADARRTCEDWVKGYKP